MPTKKQPDTFRSAIVTWFIDEDSQPATAVGHARIIWHEYFSKHDPDGDDPAVFKVTNKNTKEEYEVDLYFIDGNTPEARTKVFSDALVTWSIENYSGKTFFTAAQHAQDIWQDCFRRDIFIRNDSQPGPDEACVFTVTNTKTGTQYTIDLSDEEFAGTFA